MSVMWSKVGTEYSSANYFIILYVKLFMCMATPYYSSIIHSLEAVTKVTNISYFWLCGIHYNIQADCSIACGVNPGIYHSNYFRLIPGQEFKNTPLDSHLHVVCSGL